jgi:hypothetical protein
LKSMIGFHSIREGLHIVVKQTVAKLDATGLTFKAPVFLRVAKDSEHFVGRERL